MYNAALRASPGNDLVSRSFLERSNTVYLLVSKTTDEAFVPRKTISVSLNDFYP